MVNAFMLVTQMLKAEEKYFKALKKEEQEALEEDNSTFLSKSIITYEDFTQDVVFSSTLIDPKFDDDRVETTGKGSTISEEMEIDLNKTLVSKASGRNRRKLKRKSHKTVFYFGNKNPEKAKRVPKLYVAAEKYSPKFECSKCFFQCNTRNKLKLHFSRRFKSRQALSTSRSFYHSKDWLLKKNCIT